MLPVIAIDGPAGVGKSTAAKLAAKSLGIPYLNTGAMFRRLALALGEDGLALDDAALLASGSAHAFSLDPETSTLHFDGTPVGAEINGEGVAALASAYAKRQPMRALLAAAQRKIGVAASLVAEGRDMGTEVFPDAALKIFMDADPAIRARRRWLELRATGHNPDLASLEEAIVKRDAQDRSRAISPLRPAHDAIILDTSSLDISQTLEAILACAAKTGCFKRA